MRSGPSGGRPWRRRTRGVKRESMRSVAVRGQPADVGASRADEQPGEGHGGRAKGCAGVAHGLTADGRACPTMAKSSRDSGPETPFSTPRGRLECPTCGLEDRCPIQRSFGTIPSMAMFDAMQTTAKSGLLLNTLFSSAADFSASFNGPGSIHCRHQCRSPWSTTSW